MFVSAGLGCVLAAARIQVEMTLLGYLWGVLEGSLLHRFQVICTAIELQAGRGMTRSFSVAFCWRACSYSLQGVHMSRGF